MTSVKPLGSIIIPDSGNLSLEAIIAVKEVLQAGDIFLLKFDCPKCSNDRLNAFPLDYCNDCAAPLACYPISFPYGRDRRLLAGTFRKRRGGLSKKKIQAIFRSQNGDCAYCYEKMTNYHVEHIVPLAVGGTNDPSNLVLSCAPCNLIAGSKCFNSFFDKQQYIQKSRRKGFKNG